MVQETPLFLKRPKCKHTARMQSIKNKTNRDRTVIKRQGGAMKCSYCYHAALKLITFLQQHVMFYSSYTPANTTD